MDIAPNQFGNPQYWHKLAQQAWALAQSMSDPASKETTLRIARDYERKAREAEERMGVGKTTASEATAAPVADREAALQRLEEIDRHIALGKEHIARQREIIEELDSEGHDTTAAKELLETFLATQAAHEEHQRTVIEDLGGHSR
jgi:hypothetical protein